MSKFRLLLLDESNSYVAYVQDDIILDSNNDVSVKTDVAMQKTVYIEASTTFGTTPSLLNLLI